MEEISPSLLGSEVITCHEKFLVNICPNINPVLAQTILHKYRKDILESVTTPPLPSRNVQGVPNNPLLNIGALTMVKFLKFIEH